MSKNYKRQLIDDARSVLNQTLGQILTETDIEALVTRISNNLSGNVYGNLEKECERILNAVKKEANLAKQMNILVCPELRMQTSYDTAVNIENKISQHYRAFENGNANEKNQVGIYLNMYAGRELGLVFTNQEVKVLLKNWYEDYDEEISNEDDLIDFMDFISYRAEFWMLIAAVQKHMQYNEDLAMKKIENIFKYMPRNTQGNLVKRLEMNIR